MVSSTSRVGDPTIADVHPLTDHSLSILGKKIGTTRVSVYGEGKKLVGIIDVEVGYETSAHRCRTQAPVSLRSDRCHLGQREADADVVRRRMRRRSIRP